MSENKVIDILISGSTNKTELILNSDNSKISGVAGNTSEPEPQPEPQPEPEPEPEPDPFNYSIDVGEYPNFEFKDINGNSRTLESFLQSGKKYYLLDFFAEWCGPCKLDAPLFNALYSKYSTDAEIISIHILEDNDGIQEANKAVNDKNMTWNVLVDENNRFEINSIPKGAILDSTGKVLAKAQDGGNLPKLLEDTIVADTTITPANNNLVKIFDNMTTLEDDGTFTINAGSYLLFSGVNKDTVFNIEESVSGLASSTEVSEKVTELYNYSLYGTAVQQAYTSTICTCDENGVCTCAFTYASANSNLLTVNKLLNNLVNLNADGSYNLVDTSNIDLSPILGIEKITSISASDALVMYNSLEEVNTALSNLLVGNGTSIETCECVCTVDADGNIQCVCNCTVNLADAANIVVSDVVHNSNDKTLSLKVTNTGEKTAHYFGFLWCMSFKLSTEQQNIDIKLDTTDSTELTIDVSGTTYYLTQLAGLYNDPEVTPYGVPLTAKHVLKEQPVYPGQTVDMNIDISTIINSGEYAFVVDAFFAKTSGYDLTEYADVWEGGGVNEIQDNFAYFNVE